VKEEAEPATDRRRIAVTGPTSARLDSYLATALPELSRSRAAQLLAEGHVQVNGTAARKSYRPVAGDVIDVTLPAPLPSTVEAESIPLNVVYEDGDLLVVDKPAGLVVHPAPGHRTGTLVNALLHHVTDLSGIGGELRPGIVHRLDKDTSGLLLIAKNDNTHRRLSAALKRREIRRIYQAAAWGHLKQDDITVDAPIARASGDRRRMAVLANGRPARTHLRRLARWPAADLVRVELETGRTHQIRVHLAHIGHPVVGDTVYGSGAERGVSGQYRRWAAELARRVTRQFLHAAELDFAHPRTGAQMHFAAPLPPDLQTVMEWVNTTQQDR
jgi:23S rRNA pseudouridine1911/1915/1917 synthase